MALGPGEEVDLKKKLSSSCSSPLRQFLCASSALHCTFYCPCVCFQTAVYIDCFLLVPCWAWCADTWLRRGKAQSLTFITRTGQRNSRISDRRLLTSWPITSHLQEPPLAPCCRQGHYSNQIYYPQNSPSWWDSLFTWLLQCSTLTEQLTTMAVRLLQSEVPYPALKNIQHS